MVLVLRCWDGWYECLDRLKRTELQFTIFNKGSMTVKFWRVISTNKLGTIEYSYEKELR